MLVGLQTFQWYKTTNCFDLIYQPQHLNLREAKTLNYIDLSGCRDKAYTV